MTVVDRGLFSIWGRRRAFGPQVQQKSVEDQLTLPEQPPDAELDPIVKSSAVRIHQEAFARLDAEARRQQRSFRRELTIANVCLMLAGVLSGLVLTTVPLVSSASIPEGVLGEAWTTWLPRSLGIATLALGAAAAFYTYKAREGNRLQRWLSARSSAELARSSMYMAIAEKAASGPGNVAKSALKFINRELLEEQRRWYHDRVAEHRRSSDWTTGWGGLATALSFIGGSGAVIASFEPSQTWIAVCGVIGAAIGAYAVNRESLRLDSVSAEGYEKAAAALDAIAARYDVVEAEVTAGRSEAVRSFTTAITEQLTTEHRRWLEASAQTRAILDNLDVQLGKIAAQPKAPTTGNAPGPQSGAADKPAGEAP